MLFSVWSYGQNVTVQGKVTDASTKETVPFASLLVKGTSSGTSSDLDGSYVLSVPRNATLIVSSLGYRTVEVAVEGRSRLDIALEPDTEFLEDVVITAQGLTRKQKALGYSTQKVTSEELTIARQSDLSNAIVGKVAGVQFFGGSGSSFSSGQIVLRGAGTLSAASGGSLSVNEPIYVVDGTITNKNAVNMDDVESINVLKGPAATALYGSRGGDGAIIITTKSAESGKGTVDFSHTTTVETYYNHVNLQTLYGGGQYGYLFGEATGTTSAAKLLRDYPGSIESLKGAKIMDYGNDASWGPRFDPSVKYVTPLSVDPTSSKYGIPDTWESHLNLSDLYKTGVANITNIAFSKSYKDLSTRVSFTNNQRTGIQPNSDAIRRNLSIKANYSPASWLDVSLDYLYTYRRDHNPASSGYNGNRTVLQEYTQWGQTNINLADYKDYMRPDGSWRSWNVKSISNNTANYHDNPYALFHEYNTYDTYQWNVFSADATVKLPFNIKAGVRYNANIRSYIGETKRPSGSINFTSYYAQLQSGVLDDTVQGHLTWGGSFVNDKLSVEAAAFAEARNYQYDVLDAHTNSSYGLSIDNFYNLSASTGTTAVVTNTKTSYAERSIYGTATVGWDDTYYIDGSLRNDWSSTLSPENNSYLYGGLSVSVIASNWFSAPWLNMWKIRASAAQLGSSMGAYNIYPTYTIGTKYGPNSTMYETATQVNYNSNFCPNEYIVEALKDYGDPRLFCYFSLVPFGGSAPVGDASDPAAYVGMKLGIPNVSDYAEKVCYFSESLSAAEGLLPIITAARVNLVAAEAAERGWISADAKSLYEAGVKASFEQWGAKDVDVYLASDKVAYAGTKAQKLEKIAMQRWLSGYMADGVEAWSDTRRLHVPAIEVGPAAVGITHIPYRMKYSGAIAASNKKNYESAVSAAFAGTNDAEHRIWWDVK